MAAKEQKIEISLDTTGMDEAASRLAASALECASEDADPHKRWVLISLFAETHRRVARILDDHARAMGLGDPVTTTTPPPRKGPGDA